MVSLSALISEELTKWQQINRRIRGAVVFGHRSWFGFEEVKLSKAFQVSGLPVLYCFWFVLKHLLSFPSFLLLFFDPLIIHPALRPLHPSHISFSRFRPPLRLSVFSLMCCQQGALATGCKSHRQGNILWSAVAEAFVGRRGDVNGCCILSSLDLLLRGEEVRRSNIKSLMSVMHLSGCLT